MKLITASSKPTILCLHGGGTSASIFKIQSKRLQTALSSYFDFVFIDGPFYAPPGPGVLPVFEGAGPFFEWKRPASWSHMVEGQSDSDSDETEAEDLDPKHYAPKRTRELIQRALEEQISKTGRPFAGILGFSQGARLAAGLLWEQQQLLLQCRSNAHPSTWTMGDRQARKGFLFGVFLMGTFPPLKLGNHLVPCSNSTTCSCNTSASSSPSSSLASSQTGSPSPFSYPDSQHKTEIDIPSIHIVGTRDPFRESGRTLFSESFDINSAKLLDMSTGHHLPVLREENRVLAAEILRAYKEGLKRREMLFGDIL